MYLKLIKYIAITMNWKTKVAILSNDPNVRFKFTKDNGREFVANRIEKRAKNHCLFCINEPMVQTIIKIYKIK